MGAWERRCHAPLTNGLAPQLATRYAALLLHTNAGGGACFSNYQRSHMDTTDPISVELYSQAAASNLEPGLVRSIISLQRGWRVSRRAAQPEEGFLATEFAESEVHALYEDGGTFFVIRRGGDALGFALTTRIAEFTEQYDSAPGSKLHLSEPVDLAAFVYLYQIVIRKGEQQRGLGKHLMQHVQQHHKTPILADVLLSPVPNLGSKLFFTRLGFKSVGVLSLANYRDYGPLSSEVLINTGRSLR